MGETQPELSGIKLTHARREALQLVADGEVIGVWPFGPRPMEWRDRKDYRRLRSAKYDWLLTNRLIEVRPAKYNVSEILVTDFGEAVLRER